MNEETYFCNSCNRHHQGEPSKIRRNQKWCQPCFERWETRMAEIHQEQIRRLNLDAPHILNGVEHH